MIALIWTGAVILAHAKHKFIISFLLFKNTETQHWINV